MKEFSREYCDTGSFGNSNILWYLQKKKTDLNIVSFELIAW